MDLDPRAVWIGGWLFVHRSLLGGRIPVLALDTDLPDNVPDDRHITDERYGGICATG
jgi:starch phosphorylase